MSHAPIASIIIPTYNYARYISEAIDSVLASTLSQKEYEIIIIDDGSSDNTEEVVDQYRDKAKYIATSNLGKANATRIGILESQGKYIFNLDADDLFLPDKLEKIINKFEDNPRLVHIGHPAICWNVVANQKSPENIPKEFLNIEQIGTERLNLFYKLGLLFGGGSTFSARADILKSRLIPSAVDMFIDEYLILVTLACGNTLLIDEPLSIWRIHGNNFSRKAKDSTQSPTLAELNRFNRITNSLNATRENLPAELGSDFEVLYRLKISSIKLAIQEDLGIKSWQDINNHIGNIGLAFQTFGLNTLSISQKYHVFNRLLPTSLIKQLKALLKK
jgi:glycosyltransferase involved in cell wall biosynthesis